MLKVTIYADTGINNLSYKFEVKILVSFKKLGINHLRHNNVV